MTDLYELGLYSFQFIFWTATQHVSRQSLGRFAPQAWYVACICIKHMHCTLAAQPSVSLLEQSHLRE